MLNSIKGNAFGITVQWEFSFPFSHVKHKQDWGVEKINDLNKIRFEHEDLKSHISKNKFYLKPVTETKSKT